MVHKMGDVLEFYVLVLLHQIHVHFTLDKHAATVG